MAIADERKVNAGPSAALGKVTTAGTLGTLATWLAAQYGRRFIGDAIDDPLYFSLASSAVLAVLLNVKLYGLVVVKYLANRYLPTDFVDALKQQKTAQRTDTNGNNAT